MLGAAGALAAGAAGALAAGAAACVLLAPELELEELLELSELAPIFLLEPPE